jgi:hypothetical protein
MRVPKKFVEKIHSFSHAANLARRIARDRGYGDPGVIEDANELVRIVDMIRGEMWCQCVLDGQLLVEYSDALRATLEEAAPKGAAQ